MQFLKERNLLKKNNKLLPCLFCFFSTHHQLKSLSPEWFARVAGKTWKIDGMKRSPGLSKAAMMSFQFSSVMQRQSPVDGECRSVLVKHCESRWIPGKKITSGSRYFPRLAPCCYIAWIRVPEYLCHKSMALVTMASVFSCGILHKNLTTPSGRLMPINIIL